MKRLLAKLFGDPALSEDHAAGRYDETRELLETISALEDGRKGCEYALSDCSSDRREMWSDRIDRITQVKAKLRGRIPEAERDRLRAEWGRM